MLFCGCQNALQTNQQQIVDQKTADLFWTAAHVILFKSRDALADGRFHFALSHHRQHPVRAKLKALKPMEEITSWRLFASSLASSLWLYPGHKTSRLICVPKQSTSVDVRNLFLQIPARIGGNSVESELLSRSWLIQEGSKNLPHPWPCVALISDDSIDRIAASFAGRVIK